MANDARIERQLMRQQGTGTGDVETTDFGFAFDAGSREERQLMRQRGAGNRQINNIDFGFAFATPSTVNDRRSQTPIRTPATVTRKPAHPRTTPTPPVQEAFINQQNVSSARSTRSRQTPDVLRDGPSGPRQRKRRRLSEISNMTAPRSVGRPLSVVGNTVIEGEDEVQQGPEVTTLGETGRILESDNQKEHGPIPTSSLFSPESTVTITDNADKENEHSGLSSGRPATKKRKRKSIGQQSLFKKKRTSSSLRPSLPTPSETHEESVSVEGPRTNRQSIRRERRWSIASSEPPSGPSSSSSPAKQVTQQPMAATPEISGSASSKRRRKRKSVVQGKTKRRSTATVASTPSHIEGSVERGDEAEQNGEQEEEEENEPNEPPLDLDIGTPSELELENEQLRPGRRAARPSTNPRRFTSEQPEQIDLGDAEDADDTFLPAEASPDPTPAPKRAKQKRQKRQQPKTTRRRAPNSAAASQPTGVQKRSRKSGFPILTHRMTNLHALPTITEVPEEDHQHDPDADELALPTPQAITTRTTPNAVDVLAQVCREAIDSSISALKSQNLPRADLTRRFAALESFRSTLDTRLFDLSQFLDQRLNIEARLRRTRREKAELQSRWLEIRRQRDQHDLRKDAVRSAHWEAEVLSRRKFEASQAAFALEGVVDHQQESGEGEDGLELRLRQVANDVSSVDGGGVLRTLRGFNARLERLAGALG